MTEKKVFGSLRANADFMQGSISFTKEFHSLSGTAKVDLLQDWLRALERAYEKARAAWGKELGTR